MKKLGLLVAGIILSITTATSAAFLEGQVISKFAGENPAGTIYVPVGDNLDLGIGLGIDSPDADNTETGYELGLALRSDTDFFGDVEISTGIQKTTTEGSDTTVAPIKVTRHFLYEVTKGFSLGLSLDVLWIGVDGDYKVNGVSQGKGVKVLPGVYPVVAANIAL